MISLKRSNLAVVASLFSQSTPSSQWGKVILTVVAALGSLLSSTPTIHAGHFHVEISTADLSMAPANANAPFYLDFQFNDGGVLGNNHAIIKNFTFGGGNAAGSATQLGGALGDISSSVTFNNNSVFQELYQEFSPGTTISFDVALTQNLDGITPDSFVIAVLDKDLFNIPTDGLGDSLLQIDINQSGPLTVNLGSGTGIYASVTASAIPVPEPSTIIMFGLGIAGTVSYTRRRRNSATA